MYTDAMDRVDRRLFFKFLNSHHHNEGVTDWFANRELFARWLSTERVAESGLIEVSTADVELARATRDALNALIDDDSLRNAAQLDAIARELPLHVRFEAAGSHLEPAATGIRGLTARVLGIAHDAMRLSHCNNETCQWAFLDESKNHSRRWCDMKSCGTKAKSRAYRARQRELRERARQ
jgi:predicted RNA-binding Zn ribbon-like protein